jgi:Trypsin
MLALALTLALVGLSLTAVGASANANASAATTRASIVRRHDRALSALRRLVRGEGRSRAHESIVGGEATSIYQLPWQVAVFAVYEVEEGLFEQLCGGSIVRDYSHVLTAGHCLYGEADGQKLAPEDFLVAAGVSNLAEIGEGPTSQVRFVSGVRAHPYYDHAAGPGTPDDVGELELESPLAPSAAVSPAALASSSLPPSEGTGVVSSGFGEQLAEPDVMDGYLYSLGLVVLSSWSCGGEGNALFVCASTPAGTACNGDSGGGLLEGSLLIGVDDTGTIVNGHRCLPGSEDGFANVTAPEIRDFVEGSEAPPRAPRGGGGVVIRGVIRADQPLTCEPGYWTNSPTFIYAFVDSADNHVLHAGGSSLYPLTNADVGRTIFCEVCATNSGGTGTTRTGALPAIEPATSAAPAAAPAMAPAASGVAGVLGEKAQRASPARIAALLRKALLPTGTSAKIARLARAGGYTLTFAAPEAGTVIVKWYRSGASTAMVSGGAAKRSLVATGRRTFSRAGAGRVVVKLTPAGRRWLRGKRRAALVADGSFTTPGAAPVSVSRGFVLSH